MGQSGKELVLRPVTTSDASFLNALCNDPRVRAPLALNEHDVAYWARAIDEWHSDPDEEAFTVYARELQRPIGWVAVNGLSGGDGTAWVKMMALIPDTWGQGYCRICMRLVTEMLKARAIARVHLWTDSANRPAIRCYEGSGFVRIDQQPRVVGDPPQRRLRDLMECQLS